MTFWAALNGTPHALRWVEAEGMRLRCLDAGTGPETIIMVHGLGGQLEVFGRNIAALAARYRVIALDLPGHGYSAKPDLEYEIGAYIWAIRSFLQAIEMPSAHFVGLAMGAWICSRLAALYPEHVRTLTLIAPAGMRADQSVMDRMKAMSAQAATGREGVRQRLEWLLRTPSEWSDELIDIRWDIYNRDDYRKVQAKLMCLQDPEIRARNLLRDEEVKAIAKPVMLAMVDDDPSGSHEDGRLIANLLPHATTRFFSDSRHMPNFEEPDRFNDFMLAFLAEHAAPTTA